MIIVFHVECLDEWLIRKFSCPNCNQKPSSNDSQLTRNTTANNETSSDYITLHLTDDEAAAGDDSNNDWDNQDDLDLNDLDN
jgi:hypothetical protein